MRAWGQYPAPGGEKKGKKNLLLFGKFSLLKYPKI
jgi:hypothetical protein